MDLLCKPCRRQKRIVIAENRLIRAHEVPPENLYADNVVITSRYTLVNFVPKFLFEQLTRFANAYFLVVCALQSVPAISITSGFPTSLVPLGFVLFFDAVVTAREDYQRHVDDARDNSRPTLAVRNKQFVSIPWRDVRVGDVLKVRRGEVIPADLVFLRAHSDDETADADVCYVQTAQLDGETNLKMRRAVPCTVEPFSDESVVVQTWGHVECEPPNEFFHKFAGTLQLDIPAHSPLRFPLEASHTLLRGCVLRNVDFVYGLVVYTGAETKVRVKQQQRAGKTASVEVVINRNIMLLMLFLAMLCLLGAIGYAIFSNQVRTTHAYLNLPSIGFVGWLEKAFTFFLLNAAIVPVSLYVSMKMARTAQKMMMEKDKLLIHEDEHQLKVTHGKEGRYKLQVRSMDLNDELGRVSYIFSDKTGTLTLNYMRFRKMSVHGIAYGLGTTQIGLDRMRRMGIPIPPHALEEKNSGPAVPHVLFQDGSESHEGHSVEGDLLHAQEPGSQGERVHHFLIHMLLNHTVVPEKIRDEDGNVIGMQLSASSPDEEAYVYAGQFFGYKFMGRAGSDILIEAKGRPLRFEVLHILAYNQVRKRMSVIMRHVADGRIFVYSKGADSVLWPRLREPQNAEEAQYRADTVSQLEGWGNDGLRTLVFACREMSKSYYDSWKQRYEAAITDLRQVQKQKAGEANDIDNLMEEAERDLVLQGATANEDQLQEYVPETISLLAHAGIKIWMLTGDKQETAINIGFATRLLVDSMQQMIYTSDLSIEEVVKGVRAKAGEIEASGNFEVRENWALVIDDRMCDHLLSVAPQELLHLAMVCKAVICCRARPDQKARLVAMIKQGVPSARTLAIGDGANDVDMIQEAHVGVGIAGAEGVQAANASDFAIARFHYLRRLLLVHGRWNYRRMAKLVCYMFYKNIMLVIAQMLYSIFTGWSGQKYFIELAVQDFNMTYSGLPILMLAVMDQDVSAECAQRFPQLYDDGPKGKRLNNRIFWGWCFSGILDACIVFILVYFGVTSSFTVGDSLHGFEMGTYVINCVVVAVNVRIAIEMHLHHWLFQLLVFLSVFSLIPTLYFFDVVDADGFMGGVSRVYGNPNFWCLLLLAVFTANLRIILVKLVNRYFTPELRHIVQEAQIITQDYAKLDAAHGHVDKTTVPESATPSAPTTPSAARAGAAAEGKAEPSPGSNNWDTEIAEITPAESYQGSLRVESVRDTATGRDDVGPLRKLSSNTRGYTGYGFSVDEDSADNVVARIVERRSSGGGPVSR